jgi:hypothetical protein
MIAGSDVRVRNVIGVKNGTTDMGQLIEMIRLAPPGRRAGSRAFRRDA